MPIFGVIERVHLCRKDTASMPLFGRQSVHVRLAGFDVTYLGQHIIVISCDSTEYCELELQPEGQMNAGEYSSVEGSCVMLLPKGKQSVALSRCPSLHSRSRTRYSE